MSDERGFGEQSTLAAGDDGLDATPEPAVEADVAWQARKAKVFGALFSKPVLRRFGRYVVLDVLGQGGMGVVLKGYDEELDRQVAIKLLHRELDAQHTARLRREAQAMAKLSHPNVVQVYEVGELDGQTFVAMEMVKGRTVRAWMDDEPRPGWKAGVELFLQLGEGLAAAHKRGLVHRDFKPGNAIVDEEGRARVLDFGLARQGDREEEQDEPPSVIQRARTDAQQVVPLETSLTETGAVLGTPAYMPAEQMDGRPADARSDQFSFCVALYEAVYGERPYEGSSMMALMVSMRSGAVRPAPRGSDVPVALRKVLLRGLAVEPEARWPTMEALLGELRWLVTPRVQRMRWVWAAAIVATVGAGIEGVRRWEEHRRTLECQASAAEIDAAWNPERRQALQEGLVATGVSYAPTTAQKVMPWLDAQAQAWSEARVEACMDARVRDQWDEETLDRSLGCLDERRMELQSLVDELTAADATTVQKAVGAAAGLESVARCRDEAALRIMVPPPPEQRETVREVRNALVRVGTMERTGHYEQGLEEAREVLVRAEAVGWRPLLAEARLSVGSLQGRMGAYAAAEVTLEDAYFEAAGGVAPTVAFGAAASLHYLVGYKLARHDDGRRWGRHAEAALMLVDDGEGLRRALLLDNLASVRDATGAYEEAKALHERALAIREKALGPDHPDVAGSLNNLANVHLATGAYEDAKALHERALAIREKALGLDHSSVAQSLNNLATVHEATGAYEDAKALHERALAIREKALGPDHSSVAQSLNNLANVHEATGAYEDAKALHERALAIQEKALGPDHSSVAQSLNNLANVHYATGAYEDAKALHERALAIREKALGPDHPDVATSLNNLAGVHQATGAYEQAKALYERALAISEKALGPDHPNVAMSLNNLAAVHRATGAYEDAKALYERALAIREKALGPDHPDVAASLNNLANVHHETGAYEDAKALHERALAIKEKALGPDHPDVAASLNNLANVHHETGAYEDAKALHERALAIKEKALGHDHPEVSYSLQGLANVALAQHRPQDALPLAERALAIREKASVPAPLLAITRFLLARALWDAPADAGRDRPRAHALAEQARDALREAGTDEAKDLAEIEAWLTEHRLP